MNFPRTCDIGENKQVRPTETASNSFDISSMTRAEALGVKRCPCVIHCERPKRRSGEEGLKDMSTMAAYPHVTIDKQGQARTLVKTPSTLHVTPRSIA